MYSIYEKDGGAYVLRDRKVSMFGCNQGWIPKLLHRQGIPAAGADAVEWHVDVGAALGDADRKNGAFIINLKSNNVGEEGRHLTSCTTSGGIAGRTGRR